MKINHLERGQALIVIALALVGITGLVGLVIDGGNAFQDRQKAQNAADAAALASAFTRIKGGDMVGAALASAAENGYNNDGVNNVVVLYSPPRDGPYAGNIEYIQIIITSHVNTYFARVIGRQQIVNTVEATARTKSAEIKPLLNGRAVVSLAPESNCMNRLSFWVHGEATLDITGGGIFVNSDNPTCALVEQGNGSLRVEEGYTIDIVGGASIQKLRLITPEVTVGAGPINYPPPFFMPKVGCSKEAEILEDGTTMSSGSWGDIFPPPGVTRLEGGVYCLGNGMHITGNLEGHNVIFRVDRGEVRFNSNADIILDAPNSGVNAGLLLYLPMDNRSKVVLNGGPGSVIKGTILAPAAPILIKGMDSKRGFHSQIIGYTIEADGTSNVVIVYNPEQNFQSLSMPEIEFSE
ncbi:MAG TPA: pilus assembly protein TadG-related protein [Anaerolineales bacterium]|nr:pilus assembly protein TadG-related protein [Anaerolineales bacterium]